MRVVSYTRSTNSFPGNEEILPNAISQQNEHITAFAKKRGWKIAEKYSDRKHDPKEDAAFQRLLEDGMNRKFDVVIVDSVYTAAVNLFVAREVLLQTFFYSGIRFCVAEDDYDGTDKTEEEAKDYFAAKNKTYRAAKLNNIFVEKNKAGILTKQDETFGLVLTEENTLAADSESAPIVRKIYDLFLEGCGVKEIVAELEKNRIRNPLSYNGRKVMDNWKGAYHWTPFAVERILRQKKYTGQWVKETKGFRREYHTEVLIPEKDYQKVQTLWMSQKRKTKKGYKHYNDRYKSKVYDEKGNLLRQNRTVSGLEYYGLLRSKEENGYLPASEVDLAVRRAFAEEKEAAVEAGEWLAGDMEERISKRLNSLRAELTEMSMLLAEREKERFSLQQKLSEGLVNEEDVRAFIEERDLLLQNCEKCFAAYQKQEKQIELAFSKKNPWIVQMLSYDETMEINFEMVRKYISRIIVENMKNIRVEFQNFEWKELILEERGIV